jgi:methylmalonyl-CoA/ethylmalonyl-CoA epimerase
MSNAMNINHIGIVTKSLEKGIKLWTETFGYKLKTTPVINSRQKVRVVFLEKNDSIDIKLLEPVDDSSPVYRFSLKGGGLHHLCFKCDSLDLKLEELKDDGFRLLAGPEPGEAFENENIAFIYATQGLNIELIDTDKRAQRINEL